MFNDKNIFASKQYSYDELTVILVLYMGVTDGTQAKNFCQQTSNLLFSLPKLLLLTYLCFSSVGYYYS